MKMTCWHPGSYVCAASARSRRRRRLMRSVPLRRLVRNTPAPTVREEASDDTLRDRLFPEACRRDATACLKHYDELRRQESRQQHAYWTPCSSSVET